MVPECAQSWTFFAWTDGIYLDSNGMRSKFPESDTNSSTDMHACAEAWNKEPEHVMIHV